MASGHKFHNQLMQLSARAADADTELLREAHPRYLCRPAVIDDVPRRPSSAGMTLGKSGQGQMKNVRSGDDGGEGGMRKQNRSDEGGDGGHLIWAFDSQVMLERSRSRLTSRIRTSSSTSFHLTTTTFLGDQKEKNLTTHQTRTTTPHHVPGHHPPPLPSHFCTYQRGWQSIPTRRDHQRSPWQFPRYHTRRRRRRQGMEV